MIAEYAAKSLRHADGLIKLLGRINWCPSGIHSNFDVHLDTAARPNMTRKLKSPMDGHPSFEHIVEFSSSFVRCFRSDSSVLYYVGLHQHSYLEMVDQ